MESKYDKDIDAKYVSIKKGKVHETKLLEDWLILDVNQKGEVLGVEILDASKNLVSIYADRNNPKYLGIQKIETENNLNDFDVKVPKINELQTVAESMVV